MVVLVALGGLILVPDLLSVWFKQTYFCMCKSENKAISSQHTSKRRVTS